MENSILKELLIEYADLRDKNLRDLEKRKRDIYAKLPRLKEIESELNSISISTAKLILNKNSPAHIKELKERILKLKNERIKILNKLGKDENYLKPIYSCNLCKDTGYILKNNKSIMCNCLKQKLFNISYNKANVSNLDKENFKTFNLNLYSDKINEEKYNSNSSPRQNIKIIKEASLKFIDNFDNPGTKNLLFTGSPGLR